MLTTRALSRCIVQIVLFACLTLSAAAADPSRRPNVLFIAVDDLRPELGCYGAERMHTPNIDRLAAQGTVFERAYCMVPTCGASRASLMTGVRPARNRFVNYLTWAEKDAPGIPTLNTHFKKHGYYTISNGKIFHHATDNAEGWSEPAWRPKGVPTYQLAASQALQATRAKQSGQRGRGPAFESADVADDAYADGKVLEKSVRDLRRLAKMDKPFFLATGFFKPHLPFVAPKKYWDLYDRDRIHLPETYRRPKDAPDVAIHNWGELRAYADVPARGPLPDEMARTLIHGYYACVSYTDAQIGKLLDELERLGVADNTIVILWGDHGWNLGEHTLWCKHSCFETSMHAPLIVAAPGIAGGVKTGGLTEFIDIYPSLCELADLAPPDHLQGKSFVPLMSDPSQKWKPSAIGRYINGDTIRTDKYRFTEYTTPGGGFRDRMLYDHQSDPQEDANVSGQKPSEGVVRELTEALHKGKGKKSD
ncbi:MAG: sulfatase [Candidatus Nealsonbacteria bacterium]|nr:sulfatase [Candidatus Nealsonbacteria bacterium]